MQRVSALLAALVLVLGLVALVPGQTDAQEGTVCTGPSLDEISECFRTCANLFTDPEAQASCVNACGRINGAS